MGKQKKKICFCRTQGTIICLKQLCLLLFFISVSCVNGSQHSQNSSDVSQEEKLEAYVRGMKKTTLENIPMEVDEGMMLTNFDFISGYNYVVFTIECDETMCDIEEMRRNRKEIKTLMIDNAREQFTPEMISDCEEIGIKELQYKYVGVSSGKTFVIHIKPSELYDHQK